MADPGALCTKVSYLYNNQKITVPPEAIEPAFCGYGSSILYVPITTSSGKLGNPFGSSRFTITDVALVWRYCTFHGMELHGGWDLALGYTGTPIYAVSAGKVVVAGPFGGYGNHVVVIQSGDKYVLYGHMSEMRVRVGDSVQVGDRVGSQGS